MRRRTGLLVAGAAIAGLSGGLVAAQPESSGAQEARPGVAGRFSLIMMVHTRSSSFGDLPGVMPWNGRRAAGEQGAYRSIPCTGNAPVNNISSDLPSYGTRVQGSRAPSSMRAHPFSFDVRKRRGRWEMVGTIRFTVCQLQPGPTRQDDPVPDADKPTIVVRFRAPFKRESAESLRFSGRFRIVDGTQRYDDLSGSGSIAGYLFCFAPEGCPALGGNYLDGQFVMHGRYRDPTPELAG